MMSPKNTYFFLVSKWFFLLFLFNIIVCCAQSKQDHKILTAANQTEKYVAQLSGLKVAIVANQTSVIESKVEGDFVHLVDSLMSLGIDIVKVFAPEHGFRGRADAGEHVKNQKDIKTGLPIISLYGKNRKPSSEQIENVDVVLFDIQDVGARFYTYISTMTYVMEACGEAKIPVIVLDRPNPNGHYVDGPTLKIAHKSFVGMHPVPLVYGMTIGEYAQMVNGEKWMKNNVQCNLTIIHLKNYSHESEYDLPLRPSPNLPNNQSINLYPSLGFFEGTIINAGRGTEFQFQRYGAPFFPNSKEHQESKLMKSISYTPQPNFGSKQPKFNGEKCYGVDLTEQKKLSKVDIQWILDAYHKTPKTENFFGKTFTVHAGSLELQRQIEAGKTAQEIHESWQPEIEKFKNIREKYLIYN